MELILIMLLSLAVSEGYNAVAHPGPTQAYCVNVEPAEEVVVDEPL